jgi:hypothetical protein
MTLEAAEQGGALLRILAIVLIVYGAIITIAALADGEFPLFPLLIVALGIYLLRRRREAGTPSDPVSVAGSNVGRPTAPPRPPVAPSQRSTPHQPPPPARPDAAPIPGVRRSSQPSRAAGSTGPRGLPAPTAYSPFETYVFIWEMNAVTFDQHLHQFGELSLQEVTEVGREAAIAAGDPPDSDPDAMRIARLIMERYVTSFDASVEEQTIVMCAASARVGMRLAQIERERGWVIGPHSVDPRIWAATGGIVAGMQAELQRKGWALDEGPAIRALACIAGYSSQRESLEAVLDALSSDREPQVRIFFGRR